MNKATDIYDGFKEYFLRDDVFRVAIAVVFGKIFADLVTSIIGDVISPLISDVFNLKADSLQELKYGHIKYGNFLYYLIIFIVTILVLYFIFIIPLNSIIQDKRSQSQKHEDLQEERMRKFIEKATEELDYLKEQREKSDSKSPTSSTEFKVEPFLTREF